MIALLCALVFASATAIDFAHARYAAARDRHRAHLAARWSVAQWSAATVGFVVAVRVSLWILPFEVAGLYLGTWLGVRALSREAQNDRTCN